MKIQTYNKLLQEFCKYKKTLIVRYTGIEYYDERDIKEIGSWPENDCKTVLSSIEAALLKKVPLDANLCPWCVLPGIHSQFEKFHPCKSCGYATRHGNCGEGSSIYALITAHIKFLREKDLTCACVDDYYIKDIPRLLTNLRRWLPRKINALIE